MRDATRLRLRRADAVQLVGVRLLLLRQLRSRHGAQPLQLGSKLVAQRLQLVRVRLLQLLGARLQSDGAAGPELMPNTPTRLISRQHRDQRRVADEDVMARSS